mmetsp:Transcript_3094/g.2580  ORF Transcript_3094/g.2580 Transcript_3094/m.2580 type:complete len:326 (+) Transcript_3094:22-999(+)
MDREQAVLGPDLLKYERKELLRASKRIKTKSASRAKQLALRTRAAAAAAKKPAVEATSEGPAPTASRGHALNRPAPQQQHTKRSAARLQHARLLERYGDLTRLSLETQSQLEDSEGRIQRLLKRRGSLSEQRIQIDEEVTALQRKIRDMVAATLEAAAAAAAQQQTSVESDESHETASVSSSQSPPMADNVIDDSSGPKPTHHVPTNPHLNRARARLGKLVKRWKPNQDKDDRIEKDREAAEQILSQRQPSPKRRRSRPPEISIEMASAVVDEDDDEEGEDMEILTEGEEVAVTDEDMEEVEESEEDEGEEEEQDANSDDINNDI